MADPKKRAGAKSAGSRKPKKRKISEAAKAFADLIADASFQHGPIPEVRPLLNLTFWAGAGFSKSWDPNCPVGSELFTLSSKAIDRIASPGVFSRLFGIDTLGSVSPDELRQIVYQLDMYERYPDVRSRYIDDQNIAQFRGRLKSEVVRRFNELAGLNYFDRTIAKFPLAEATDAQKAILGFFSYLGRQADGSTDFVEGVRSHFITTNYDYVIETILDNSLAPDDTLFLYTYRGFTPDTFVDLPNTTPIHDHWLSQHLLKINGGFEILRDGAAYALDYSDRLPAEIARNPPVLMLPSREQDYTDPYFRAVFPKAVRLLRETNVLVIVGYSLPEDDALIRFIIRQFAEEPEDGRDKVIFYVAPVAAADAADQLSAIFPSLSMSGAPHMILYEGGFDAFAAECVKAWKSIEKDRRKQFVRLP